MTDLGMAVLVLLAGTAKRDAVQDRDIIVDHGGLAAHKTGGMIEKDAAADLGGGIDVGLEHRRRAALQIEREILAALMVEPVRQTMGLDGMKTLEVEQGIDEARDRGIAIVDRDQIGAEGVAEIRVVAQRLVIGLADQIARQRRMVEAIGQTMH